MILICDDDAVHVEDIIQEYRDQGYLGDIKPYSTCESMLEGLASLYSAKKTPDVIMLDMLMLGMDGLECLDIMKKEYPPFAVVVMTGAFTPGVAAEAYYRGANAVIEKPLDWRNIICGILNLWVYDIKPQWDINE